MNSLHEAVKEAEEALNSLPVLPGTGNPSTIPDSDGSEEGNKRHKFWHWMSEFFEQPTSDHVNALPRSPLPEEDSAFHDPPLGYKGGEYGGIDEGVSPDSTRKLLTLCSLLFHGANECLHFFKESAGKF